MRSRFWAIRRKTSADGSMAQSASLCDGSEFVVSLCRGVFLRCLRTANEGASPQSGNVLRELNMKVKRVRTVTAVMLTRSWQLGCWAENSRDSFT